jgi:protein phosphatase
MTSRWTSTSTTGRRRPRPFCRWPSTSASAPRWAGAPRNAPTWPRPHSRCPRNSRWTPAGNHEAPEAKWLNRTICIDTGCVFGGRLTALPYPERELVSVPARKMYWQPARPLVAAPSVDAARVPTDLDLDDVVGKRIITTRLSQAVTIGEENSIAALEVMSRFAADPVGWCTCRRPWRLPPRATAWARSSIPPRPSPRSATTACRQWCARRSTWDRVPSSWCAATRRSRPAVLASMGVRRQVSSSPAPGGPSSTMPPGRRLSSPRSEPGSIRSAVGFARHRLACAGLRAVALVGQAEEVLRRQYASVGTSPTATLAAEVAVLVAARTRGADVGDLLAREQQREAMAAGFVDAYRHYCWPVDSVDDLRLAGAPWTTCGARSRGMCPSTSWPWSQGRASTGWSASSQPHSVFRPTPSKSASGFLLLAGYSSAAYG